MNKLIGKTVKVMWNSWTADKKLMMAMGKLSFITNDKIFIIDPETNNEEYFDRDIFFVEELNG